MRVMVCGPIGLGGTGRIRRMAGFLAKNGFEVSNQFGNKGADYSGTGDFRNRKGLSRSIVRHDLALVRRSDVLVVLQVPSFGAAMEMFFAKELGKITLLFADRQVPSPWPVNFADFIARDKRSLLEILDMLARKNY